MSNGPPGTRTSARSGGEGAAGGGGWAGGGGTRRRCRRGRGGWPRRRAPARATGPRSCRRGRDPTRGGTSVASAGGTGRPRRAGTASRGSGGEPPPGPWRSAHARPSRLHGRLVARGHEPGKVAVAGRRRPRIHQLVRRGPPAGDEAVVIGGAGRLHRAVHAEPWESRERCGEAARRGGGEGWVGQALRRLRPH